MTVISERGASPPLIARLRATRLPPPSERRALRKAAGATLTDVAVELKVSDAAVSCWERGIYDPRPSNVPGYLRLLKAFAELASESRALATRK